MEQELPLFLSSLLSQGLDSSNALELVLFISPKQVHLEIFRFSFGLLINDSAHLGFWFRLVSGIFCQDWSLVQEREHHGFQLGGGVILCFLEIHSANGGPQAVVTPGGGNLSFHWLPLKREQ